MKPCHLVCLNHIESPHSLNKKYILLERTNLRTVVMAFFLLFLFFILFIILIFCLSFVIVVFAACDGFLTKYINNVLYLSNDLCLPLNVYLLYLQDSSSTFIFYSFLLVTLKIVWEPPFFWHNVSPFFRPLLLLLIAFPLHPLSIYVSTDLSTKPILSEENVKSHQRLKTRASKRRQRTKLPDSADEQNKSEEHILTGIRPSKKAKTKQKDKDAYIDTMRCCIAPKILQVCVNCVIVTKEYVIWVSTQDYNSFPPLN